MYIVFIKNFYEIIVSERFFVRIIIYIVGKE